MPKKTRRSLSKRPTPGTEMNMRPGSSAARPSAEFNPDYSNTKRDLRRIALLAGIFILILVILAVVQQYYPLF